MKNPNFKRLLLNSLQRVNEDGRLHLGLRMTLRSRLFKIYNHFSSQEFNPSIHQ